MIQKMGISVFGLSSQAAKSPSQIHWPVPGTRVLLAFSSSSAALTGANHLMTSLASLIIWSALREMMSSCIVVDSRCTSA